MLDNLGRYLFVDSGALIFDASFGLRCVALLGRNGLSLDQQVFFIIINVKIQRTSPL